MQDPLEHFLKLNIEDYLLKETLGPMEMRDRSNDVQVLVLMHYTIVPELQDINELN